MHSQPGSGVIAGPVVIAVRGPSRSGKTAIVERLIAAIRAQPLAIGYVKRTHHLLDLPHKASGRVWASGPSAMLVRASDRIQLTLPPVPGRAEELLDLLPPSLDLVLLETHEPEAFPTIASALAAPAGGEAVIARWSLASLDEDARLAANAVQRLLPPDLEIARALGQARAVTQAHRCAGVVLGARLALEGLRALGYRPGEPSRQLRVNIETRGCALDALQAITGCSPGRGTLTVSNYGKLAATFIDDAAGQAVRIAARPGLRSRVTPCTANRDERHELQRTAYLSLPSADLFTVLEATYPGPPGRDRWARFDCAACGEEVTVEAGAPRQQFCIPCARGAREQVRAESPRPEEKVLV